VTLEQPVTLLFTAGLALVVLGLYVMLTTK
jgi:hypothetical protein